MSAYGWIVSAARKMGMKLRTVSTKKLADGWHAYDTNGRDVGGPFATETEAADCLRSMLGCQ